MCRQSMHTKWIARARGRPKLLGVNKLEQRLEMMMPGADVFTDEGFDSGSAVGVDGAEKTLLDLIVDQRAEECRV